MSNSESPRDLSRESPKRNKKNNTNTKKSQKSNGSNGSGSKKKNELSPLHKAAKSGDLDVVKEVLSKDPKLINSQDNNNGYTPLYHACRRGRVEVVNYLIEKGADVNLGDKTGKTPLHLSAR